jgi:tetratricopeptide (TPR) repeat protein
MGKTRLIEELTRLRVAVGDLVVTARAFRMESTLPYGVVAQILKGLADPIHRSSDRIPTWTLVEAARILPNLWPETPDGPTDVLGELRVLEAIEQILNNLSRIQPTIIIVEDLQWIDPASSDLLLYLANRIRSIPITLLASHRTGEMLSQNARTLLAMADEQITLRPLAAEDIDPSLAGDHDLESLLAATGGVPILVLEEITGSGSHEGVSRYMESSLAAISDLAGQILAAASVLAGISTTDLLQEVSGRSDTELVEGIEELLRAGILREVPGSNTLGFTMDSMREVVYQSTTLVRRRQLHRRVAVTLASSQRTRKDARLAGTAATHFRDAGDERSAAEWYRIAADLARAMYAHAEAQEFLENALALGDDDVAEIRLALGEMDIARGQYQNATAQLTLAASRADGATLALVEHRLGQTNRMLGRFVQAESNYRNAVTLHPEPADLFSDWALLEHRIGNQTEATKLARRAVSFAKKTDDSILRSRVYNISAIIEEDPTKSMGLIDLAIAEDDDQVSRMASLNNRAHILSSMGNSADAVGLLLDAVAIAQETGHRHREAALLSHLADNYHRQGDTALAEETQEKAVALFADIDSGQWEPEVWLMTRW